jgi:hypothetical protein
VREFDITQDGLFWNIGLQTGGEHAVAIARVSDELDALWSRLGVVAPWLVFTDWQSIRPESKRRRIRLQQPPEGMTCTF